MSLISFFFSVLAVARQTLTVKFEKELLPPLYSLYVCATIITTLIFFRNIGRLSRKRFILDTVPTFRLISCVGGPVEIDKL